MIRKWFNSNGAQAAEMLDVSDSTIREMSNGIVNMVPYDDSDGVTGSLDDPQIFGELSAGNEDMALGHIDLAVPVVNIQYFLGKKPILAKLLAMSVRDLEKVIYFCCYVVTDPGETDMRYKQLLTEKEYVEAKKAQKVFQAEYGAAAIDTLLKKDGIEEGKNIVLNCVPVVPMCMRYTHVTKEESACGQEHFVPLTLNTLYNRVILRSNRITKLSKLGCPEIILRNESRMLQEAVDALVSNGVRGLPVCVDDNYPAYSLNELSERIREMRSAEKNTPDVPIQRKEFLDAITAEWKFESKNDLEEIEADSDDPRLAELSKLTDAVRNCVIPYTEEYIRLNYAQYKDAVNSAVRYAVAKLATVCCSWYSMCDERKKKPEDEIDRFAGDIECGLRKHIDLYFHKCVMWESI